MCGLFFSQIGNVSYLFLLFQEEEEEEQAHQDEDRCRIQKIRREQAVAETRWCSPLQSRRTSRHLAGVCRGTNGAAGADGSETDERRMRQELCA
ncbi:hypothetical protein NQZ68_010706 [Dissostichus eleginoides]|nr:hypothetical protein NQZ68_010706 [Dissostichus eleginoides]